MMDPKDLAKSQRPQSSRYRCLIEELERNRMALHKIESLTRRNGNILTEILGNLERLVDGTLRAKTGSRPDQQNPVGVEANSGELAVPGKEAFVGGIAAQEPTLSGVEEKHDSPPVHSDVEIEPPLGGQTATQRDDAEKARRIRHGEGLDLDEPQF